ncbi:MAG TPA: competence/damage-inducible protein A [Archaeoglobus profundus]|nr:competence/damage-inducible protein A [Archaeoglobus profundus]HIP57811.1 competence/damage-inducible protein A [Archaeoglobus profundus]
MEFIIISVGNELLSGDVTNTNATYIARRLTSKGHRVVRIITVPDDINEIANEIVEAKKKVDFVLVTGGLGATHDDVTNEAVARALSRKLVLYKDIYNLLKQKFPHINEEALKKICMLPEGSEVINNDVGVAPGYIIENVAVMPGVPAEMEDVFEKILPRFGESEFYEDTLRIKGYEDKILEQLNKIVKEFKDVQIGSYPKLGYVVIKFSGKDKKRVEEAKKKLAELLKV